MLELLYEDRQILVVWKPAGVESQAARGLNADMVSEIRRHIHNFSPGSAEPYVGVIHRLDKPVSGIMVYAKDKKAAAALSRQIENGSMKKQYLAVVCGKVPQNVDKFVDYLLKDKGQNQSRIVDKGVKGAKRAELLFRELEKAQDTDNRWLALLEVTLRTGRHHQIRVQMAGHGLPLWGDRKYNPSFAGEGKGGGNIALASHRLSFNHPLTGEAMVFQRTPTGGAFAKFHLCC